MLTKLAEKVGHHLLEKQLILTTAESCTGGWVAKIITDIAGSSQWFDRGFVTYTNESKQEMLKVKASTLESYGAVSLQTVEEMVIGALDHSSATLAIAVSGIAGPGGGSEEKPVGTVCFAWMVKGHKATTSVMHFNGDRESVRQQSVIHILQELLNQDHFILDKAQY